MTRKHGNDPQRDKQPAPDSVKSGSPQAQRPKSDKASDVPVHTADGSADASEFDYEKRERSTR